MHTSVLWSGLGRCALVTAAAGALISLGGCSSGVSRFDFPTFGLTRSQDAPLADGTATASLPVPPEPVYGSGGPSYAQNDAQLCKRYEQPAACGRVGATRRRRPIHPPAPTSPPKA